MSVIITRKDCTLSEANAFYRVEAYSSSYIGTVANYSTITASTLTIPLTFANAGVFKGIVLSVIYEPSQNTGTYSDATITVWLQELVGATWTNRSSKSLTYASIHNNPNTELDFATGGYIVNFTDFSDAITVDTTAGKWRIVAPMTYGTVDIGLSYTKGKDNLTPVYYAYCDTQVSFNDNDTPVFAHSCNIDTSATFGSVLTATDVTNGIAGVICSNITNPSSDTVCFLKCVSPVSAYTLTLKGILYFNGHAGFRAGTSASPIPSTTPFKILSAVPTVGTVYGSMRNDALYATKRASLFLYGECNKKLFTKLTADATANTVCTMTNANPCVITRNGHGLVTGNTVKIGTLGILPTSIVEGTTYYVVSYGANYISISDTLGGTAISTLGQTNSGSHYLSIDWKTITVSEDMSLQGWGVGDSIAIGNEDTISWGGRLKYKINSISGTSIQLTTGLNIKKWIGGSVINTSPTEMGILLEGVSASPCNHYINGLMNVNLEGVHSMDTYISGYYYQPVITHRFFSRNYIIKQTVKNVIQTMASVTVATSNLPFLANICVSFLGMDVDNIVGWKCIPLNQLAYMFNVTYGLSGKLSITNMISLAFGNLYFPNSNFYLADSSFENGQYYALQPDARMSETVMPIINGVLIDDVKFFGCADPIYNSGAYLKDWLIKNTTIDKCSSILRCTNGTYGGIGTFEDVIFKDCNFGLVAANTTGLYLSLTGTKMTPKFINCKDVSLYSLSKLYNTEGNSIKFINYSGITNNDFVWASYGNFVRTTSGLTDSTVHTAGGSALRFENTLYGTPLEWSFDVPTGNIQNKELTIGIWCKINSPTYYGTSYTKPRLTICYDECTSESESYVEAINTTDWQYLSVSVTPVTTSNQVKVKVQTNTIATGTTAYVYFDDIKVTYPIGTSLDLGSLDYFANAMPIAPPVYLENLPESISIFGGNVIVYENSYSDWSPQPDWEPIDNVLDNQINLLIGDFSLGTVAFRVTTQGNAPYTVAWGDNIIESFASNTICQHTYAKGTGKSCARGYTTFKCVISSAANLLTFKMQRHSLTNLAYQVQPFLYCVIGAKDMTSLANAFYVDGGCQCTTLEACVLPDKMNSLTSLNSTFMCSSGSIGFPSSFKYIKFPSEMNLLDNMNASFYQSPIEYIQYPVNLPKLATMQNCHAYNMALKSVILPTYTPLLNTIHSLFYSSAAPAKLVLPLALPTLTSGNAATIKSKTDFSFNASANLTIMTQMFDGNQSETITLTPNLSGVTNLSFSFQRNPYLKNIINHETLGSTTSNVDGTQMFANSELVDNLSLNCFFIAFGAYGASVSIRNKLSNLRLLNKNSPYSGVSPQINLNYTSFANAGLEQVFDDIPSNRYGKAISITGCIANVTQISKTGCTSVSGSTTILCSNTSGLTVGYEVTSPNISVAIPVSINATTDIINCTGLTFLDNTIVSFASITGTTGVTIYTPYYVVNSSGSSFQISLTSGGSFIDLSINGNATMLYASYITSINPNVSFEIDIPAYLSGTNTITAALLKRSKATLKGWTVTN